MISGSGFCNPFKQELLLGYHSFATHEFYIALYQAAAPLDFDMRMYITLGEITGPGYTAGGQLLQRNQVFGPADGTSFATFDDAVWPNSTLRARAALIYNQSYRQRAVAILDFVTDRFSNEGNFRVVFPPPGPDTALIRLS